MAGKTELNKPENVEATALVSSRPYMAISTIFLICAVLGIYFCSLQNTFYTHYQPFFDSLSYYNEIHRVMTTGQQDGLVASLQKVSQENSTVFAPKCIAALVSPVFDPSRNFGVWLQIGEVLILLLSLFCYFRIVKQATPSLAMILVTPFLLTACLYQSHGGVSDFRMDLSLYLLYAVSCVWYLISINTKRLGHFVLLGVALATTCLFRATAPVYLILSLGPLALVEFFISKHRIHLLKGLCVSSGVAVLACGWFYVSNFEHLHYYYFIWNTDANAKLPLSESARHISFAFEHVGIVFLYWVLALNVLLVVANKNVGKQSLVSALQATISKAIKGTDFRLIWLAIVPIALLVLRGAGLNPFVSMPATFGLVICLSSSLSSDRSLVECRFARNFAFALSLLALLAMGVEGWKDHGAGSFNSMAAHKQTINQIVSDANQERLDTVTLDSSHMFYLHAFSLEATMRFDTPKVKFPSGNIEIDGVRVQTQPVFSQVVAQAVWDSLEGSTEQRLDQLVSQANEDVDYLILPNKETANFLEEHVAHNLINKYQNELRRRVLGNPQWVPVGGEIKNSEQEVLQLYKNQKRVEVAQRGLGQNQQSKFR